MTCHRHSDSACPFSFTDQSEYAQNLGCLPSPHDIKIMRVVHGKTWACHSQPTRPCGGAISWLRKEGLPHKVIDRELFTEKSAWDQYTKRQE